MHDPTEGGLLNGVAEIAHASGLGVRLESAAVPVLLETRTICDAIGLDPLRLLASGSLLAVVDPSDLRPSLSALEAQGIEAAAIGEMTAQEDGLTLLADGSRRPFGEVHTDELARD
ncbi:MAG: hydrogenase expression protein, partial [Chloroflexi bacterium]